MKRLRRVGQRLLDGLVTLCVHLGICHMEDR